MGRTLNVWWKPLNAALEGWASFTASPFCHDEMPMMQVLLFDMEGVGVAMCAEEFNVKYAVVKAIVDFGGNRVCFAGN